MKFAMIPVSLLALVAICIPTTAFPYSPGSGGDRIDEVWSLKQGDSMDPPLPVPPPRPLVIWHGLGGCLLITGCGYC